MAAVIGRSSAAVAEEVSHYGADLVLNVEHGLLGHFTIDGFTKVLSDLVTERRPSIVLFGATLNGRDLASTTAARVQAGLAADCTALEINEKKRLVQIRPDFGGKALSAILAPSTRPQMATVRPGIFKPPPRGSTQSPVEKVEPSMKADEIRTRTLEVVKIEEPPAAKIETADVIVAAGLGLRSRENLHLVSELADAVGGGIAGSLAVVERGWLPSSQQVGQSGKTVAPKLYFALGISGAAQHVVGMDQSEVIVAINNDPEAPIFKVATYGIVGDLFEVVPAIVRELEKFRSLGEEYLISASSTLERKQ